MTHVELKEQMKKLWKDTFHDSDEYVKIVFDAYFNPKYVAYEENQGKVVSALLGVPYDFGWNDVRLKGLYLCGLSTTESMRHKGIMTQLITEINDKARADGFDFTFLIPASDYLRDYYYDRNYVNASYIIENRYTNIHDFKQEYITLLDAEEERIKGVKISYFNNLKITNINAQNTEEITKIITYIQAQESKTLFPGILHSEKDIIAIIEENILNRGKIYLSTNKAEEITGVVFVEKPADGTVRVRHIYNSDRCSRYRLLQAVKQDLPELSMVVEDYPEESERRSLWGKNVVPVREGANVDSSLTEVERVYRVSAHATPYFMMQILNESEILKFLARRRSECKFSILVKDSISSNVYKYEAAKGELRVAEVSDRLEEIRAKGGVVFSHRQLQEIVCRRPSDDHLVMEAFGIPRLAINGSLFLD